MADASSKQIMENLLGRFDLLAFGETHHGVHTKIFKLLGNKFDKFNRLFLEEPVDFQSSIDNFIKTGKLDERLNRSIEGATREGKNIKDTLLVILNAARKAEIPVTCVDSSKTRRGDYLTESKIGHYYLRGESRDEDIFINMMEIYKNRGEKFCFVGGSRHLEYGIHFRSGSITLGKRLKDYLGDKFYSICLWKIVKEEDKEIMEEPFSFVDIREKKLDLRFLTLVEKYNVKLIDEDGKRYFDGYFIHT